MPDASTYISVGSANLQDDSVTAAKIASNVDVTAKGFDADKVDSKDVGTGSDNIAVRSTISTEIDGDVSTHSALDTGVHGAGADVLENTGNKGAVNGYAGLDASTLLALAQIVGNVPALDAAGKLILTGSSQIGTKAADLAALWTGASDIVLDNAADRLIKMAATEMMRFESDASAVTLGVPVDLSDNILTNIGASGHDITSDGLIFVGARSTVTCQDPTNAACQYVGSTGEGQVAMNDEQSFTMEINDGTLILLELTSGESGLFFAGFKSATITELSDLSTAFDITDVDNNRVAMFKGANDNTVTIKNYTGGSVTLRVLTLNQIRSATVVS